MIIMIYAITSVVLGLCFFIIPLWAYRKGLKDGLNLNQGKAIEPIKTPVAAFEEYREQKAEKKEAKEASSAMTEGFNNVMSYDGNPQKKAGEK